MEKQIDRKEYCKVMQTIETAMKWVGTGVCVMGLSALCIGLVVVLLEVLRRK